MTSPHPASIILLGLAALLAACSREGAMLFLACLGMFLPALVGAGSHLGILFNRSKWLALAMLAMFGWFTPGTPLALVPGASREGLLLAGEGIARLCIALSVVALLMKLAPPPQLVAGMRTLLAPFAILGIPRDRIAVRLALTLREVEMSRGERIGVGHGNGDTLRLPALVLGGVDVALAGLAVMLVIGAWLG